MQACLSRLARRVLQLPERAQAALLLIPLALALAAVAANECAEWNKARSDTVADADHAAVAYAGLVANRLDTQFTELQFAAVALVGPGADPAHPAPHDELVLRRFMALHPNLFAFNIQSADGERIVWSTGRQSARPITGGKGFTPLPGRPAFLLGQDGYARRARTRVITMRYRATDEHGQTRFFVGTPYRIDQLLDAGGLLHDSAPWTLSVVDRREGSLLGVWRAGRVLGERALPRLTGVDAPVPGYPLAVVASWGAPVVLHAYRRALPVRLATELGAVLLLALASLVLWRLLRERARRLREEAYRARHDALTGLPNRFAMEQAAQQALGPRAASSGVLAVGMLDLDDFKFVNDTWGHDAGDRMLRDVAQRLASLRGLGLHAYRIGGDEFGLLLQMAPPPPAAAPSPHAHSALEPVLQALQQALAPRARLGDGIEVAVGASLGLALRGEHGSDFDALLRVADMAMYQIKNDKAGREQWWKLGASHEPKAVRESLPSAYGPESAQLLEEAHKTLLEVGDAFSATLFSPEQLRVEPTAQLSELLGCLSEVERQQLRQAQFRHMQFLLDPARDPGSLRERALVIGTLHALCGVSTTMLASAHSLYRGLLTSRLGRELLRPSIRYRLMHLVESRLEHDLEHQFEAADAVMRRYMTHLGRPIAAFGAPWVDFIKRELADLAALDGVLGVALVGMSPSGELVVESSAGANPAWLTGLAAMLDVHEPLTPGAGDAHPIRRAWFTAEAQRIDTVQAGKVAPMPWAALRVNGARSLLALPIADVREYVQKLLIIAGRYPSQFHSPWLTLWSDGLMRRLNHAFLRSLAPPSRGALGQESIRAILTALHHGGVDMHVQPIIELGSGRMRKVETLARLRLDDGTLLAPGVFLPVFGDLELEELFWQGLDKGLGQLAEFSAAGLDLECTVNMPATLLRKDDLGASIESLCRRHGIATSRLVLELLETSSFDIVEFAAAIEALQRRGVKLAIDDLGAGHSSLYRLSRVPFDVVKVDRGLLETFHEQPLQTIAMIGSLITLSRSMGREVVVEGLENEGMVEAARVLGAQYGQGFALARPLPAQELLGWWRARDGGRAADAPLRTAAGALACYWRYAYSGARGEAAPGNLSELADFMERRGAPADTVDDLLRVAGRDEGLRAVQWLVSQVRAEVMAVG